MPKRRFLALLVAIMAVVATCFCWNARAQTSQPLTPVTVSLHFNVPQLSWVGIYLAQEKGYYRDAGLDVKLQYLKGSTLAVQATAAGQSQIGLAGADSVLAAAQQKLPIITVANHIQNDATGIIVRDDGKTDAISDLGGKTIATAQAAAPAALLQAALTRAGMAGSVKVLFVDPQTVCTLLVAGRVDGCTGFNYAQLLQVRGKGVKVRFLPFSVPDRPLPGPVIFANDDFATKHADIVRAFLRATAHGYEAAASDVPASIALMQKIDTTDAPQQIAEAMPIVIGLMGSDRTAQHGWGFMTDQVWRDLYDELVDGKALQPGVDITKIYTNRYLPHAP